MSDATQPPTIALRVPGEWSHPGELLERLPEGLRLTPDHLVLSSGEKIEFIPMAPDDMFAGIFRSSCRRPPREDELAVVGRYTVKIGLKGPGGSLESALTMMQAGAAIVRAGGAGVFIDNSGLAHGGADWIQMTDDGSSDAVSFAFVSIIRGREDVYVMGMHVMGLPDFLMRSADVGEEGDEVVELIRYMCAGVAPIGVGHMLADAHGPRFQVVAKSDDGIDAHNPMHNPYGRLKIVAAKDIAESN
jgi:hypothetical protein